MKFVQNILMFSVCLAAVYILPAALANDSLVEGELHSRVLQQFNAAALSNSRAITQGEIACSHDYNTTTATINDRLLNQTTTCFESANATKSANNIKMNKTVTVSRDLMLAIQTQIATCDLIDNGSYLSCTIEAFDLNLKNLNAAYTSAHQADVEMEFNQNQMLLVRETCVSNAIADAKTNLTIAMNDYNVCLKYTRYDRLVGSN